MKRLVTLWCLLGLLSAPVLADGHVRKKTLYERLGGAYAIAGFVDEFVDRLFNDEVLSANPQVLEAMNRPGVNVPGLKFHITNLVCQAAGGPEKYTGRSMEDSHKHLLITRAEWDATVRIFKETMSDLKIPEPEQKELLEIVGPLEPEIVRESGKAPDPPSAEST
ncbi:MAG: group 1 truncated hemoglobin [Armatimonadetes bacterium]|nr:group 1 truncated hemoglobin [Armatimonadota bacterium]